MNALELRAPGVVKLNSGRETTSFGEGELIVDVDACGICGTDLRIYRHGSPRVTYPRILGHEIVGTVRSAPGVRSDLVGKRVVLAPPAIPCGACEPCRLGRLNLCRSRTAFGYELDGGFAGHVRVPPKLVERLQPIVVPDEVPSWVATLAEPISCCLNGHERLGATPSSWVVVLGAGFIGRVHNLLARLDGAKTVVVDPEPGRLADVEADARVQGSDGQEVADQIRAIVGDNLAAIVIANSAPATHELAMEVAIERTRVLLFAGCSDPQKGWRVNVVHYKEMELFGSFAALPHHVARAVELLGGPLVNLASGVERITLDEVPSFFEGRRQPTQPKVVVELRSGQ